MKIHSESRVHHPVDRVYCAYRDRLPDIAAYIPDVREIRVISREDGPNGPKLHNEWIAAREIPKIAQSVLKPEMLRWDDFAEWHDDEHYVAWTLRIPAFPENVRCAGRNTFIPDGDQATRVVLSGDLQIHLDRFPGVPRFMAKRIAPKVEEFIVKLITPNLERVNQSLEQYLDDLA